MKINKLLIDHNKNIYDALYKLNNIENLSSLILFVTDDENVVIGSLTDGDIRRALINNFKLDAKLKQIVNRNFNFKYVGKQIDVKQQKSNGIDILPILNEDGTFNSFYDFTYLTDIVPVECFIMAGGRGKRLSPLTDKIPKPLLKLEGKPIIEYTIEMLCKFGIEKIYISINYLGHLIREALGNGSKWGVEIIYIEEDIPLGTAGSLSLVDNFKSENILLMNSDVLTNVSISDLYEKLINTKADMVISSIPHKVEIPYAVFNSKKQKVSSLVEKPTYLYNANAGIYMFNKKLVEDIPKDKFYDITDLIEKLTNLKKDVYHVPITGYWIDIGKPIDYDRAKQLTKILNERQ